VTINCLGCRVHFLRFDDWEDHRHVFHAGPISRVYCQRHGSYDCMCVSVGGVRKRRLDGEQA
jgi:hypothetical protein